LYESQWDEQHKQWKTHEPDKIPTVWKANQRFEKSIRNVTTNAKSGLVTMTITWKDPKIAARWANELVETTNTYLRTKAIEEAERNISYLDSEAAKTNIVEVRQAIFQILQSEINKEMLARGSEEYAFKIVDPADAPERAVSPKKAMWILGGFLLGLLVSVQIAFLRSRRL